MRVCLHQVCKLPCGTDVGILLSDNKILPILPRQVPCGLGQVDEAGAYLRGSGGQDLRLVPLWLSVHSKVRARAKKEAEHVGKYMIQPLLSLECLSLD